MAFRGVQLHGALLQSLVLLLELHGNAELLQCYGTPFSMGCPVSGEYLSISSGQGSPALTLIPAHAEMPDPWHLVSQGLDTVPSGSIGASVKNQDIDV